MTGTDPMPTPAGNTTRRLYIEATKWGVGPWAGLVPDLQVTFNDDRVAIAISLFSGSDQNVYLMDDAAVGRFVASLVTELPEGTRRDLLASLSARHGSIEVVSSLPKGI